MRVGERWLIVFCRSTKRLKGRKTVKCLRVSIPRELETVEPSPRSKVAVTYAIVVFFSTLSLSIIDFDAIQVPACISLASRCSPSPQLAIDAGSVRHA